MAPNAPESPGGKPATWRRLAAFLIDLLALLAILAVWQVLSLLLPGMDWVGVVETAPDVETDDPDDSLISLRWPGMAIMVLYHTIGVAGWSTTPGKRVFGLWVSRPDGYRVGIGRAAARSLVYWCSAAFLMLPFLMVLFRDDQRGLHDLVCDTVVATPPPADSYYR